MAPRPRGVGRRRSLMTTLTAKPAVCLQRFLIVRSSRSAPLQSRREGKPHRHHPALPFDVWQRQRRLSGSPPSRSRGAGWCRGIETAARSRFDQRLTLIVATDPAGPASRLSHHRDLRPRAEEERAVHGFVTSCPATTRPGAGSPASLAVGACRATGVNTWGRRGKTRGPESPRGSESPTSSAFPPRLRDWS